MEPDDAPDADREPIEYEAPRILERDEIVGHLNVIQS